MKKVLIALFLVIFAFCIPAARADEYYGEPGSALYEAHQAVQDMQEQIQQERERRKHRYRVLKWTGAVVSAPVFLGVGFVYAGIIGPVTMIDCWEKVWFE
jgi:hypothetical protein